MKKILTFHKGRKCKFRRCKHILSIYNSDIFCRIHANLVFRDPVSKSRSG